MLLRQPSRCSASRAALRSTRRSAFTLMEVLVVVAIIFILASVSTVVVFRYLGESQEKIAKTAIKNIETACEAYKLSTGEYPQSLDLLTQPLNNKPAALEDAALIDPWQRPYQYDPASRNPKTGRPRIFSQGAEPGNPQGQISNW